MPDNPANAPLTEIYTEHHSWLNGWIKQRVDCAAQADDFTQDTFLRVALQPEKTKSLRQPKAFLSSIARNILLDWFRRKSIEKSYLERLAEQPELSEVSAEQRLILMELLSKVDAMLGELKERQRTIFVMAQLEGLSFVEISKRLKLSVTSVRKHYINAYAHCLAVMED